MVLYLLYENAAGFSLFELKEFDETNAKLKQVQQQIAQYKTFSKICCLTAFRQFQTADEALSGAQNVGKGELIDILREFIEENVPKSKKKGKHVLACMDNKLAQKISEEMGYECKTSDVIFELFRGIRANFTTFLKQEDFKEDQLARAQLGLGHNFSRSRIEFDVKRQDKPIINCIAVLDLLDKDINQLSMRVKEWYSWHFPELAKIVTDNGIFCKLVLLIKDKQNVDDDWLESLEEITLDQDIAQQVIDAAKISMGQTFCEIDENQVQELCAKVNGLFEFRKGIQGYLHEKMMNVAPNTTALLGDNVGAKLISHAGGLLNLVKYPASTIQILGAEKALFQALKTKGNTPKYGLLYHSSFIGKATGKNKGKISRYLANKCAISARLDHFLLKSTDRFGEKLKSQVENRLKFLATGEKTQKNIDAMDEVMNELKEENLYFESEKQTLKEKKKDKKDKKKKNKVVEEEEEVEEEVPAKKSKKSKKKQSVEVEPEEEIEEPVKKKKKKSKA